MRGASRAWLSALLISSIAGTALPAESRSPSLFAANLVQEALKGQDGLPEMKAIPRTSRELRQVVRGNLDPRLLSRALSVTGRDFAYQSPDGARRAQLSVLVLRYKTIATARQRAVLLVPLQNHLRNSKILTRFAAIPLGNLLLVAFSESSGDERIVQALKALSPEFEKASSPGSPPWEEPPR